jgi:hypothetical protein
MDYRSSGEHAVLFLNSYARQSQFRYRGIGGVRARSSILHRLQGHKHAKRSISSRGHVR